MPTKNPRINITFDKKITGLLNELALKQHISVSSLVNDLTLEALERHEDLALSDIAAIRDVAKAKKVKHKYAWK